MTARVRAGEPKDINTWLMTTSLRISEPALLRHSRNVEIAAFRDPQEVATPLKCDVLERQHRTYWDRR